MICEFNNQTTELYLQTEPTNFTNCNRGIETEISNQQVHTLYRLWIHDLNKATSKLIIDLKQNQHQLDCLTLEGLKLHNMWHWQLYTLQYVWCIHNLNIPTNKLLISCRQNQRKLDEHYAMKMDWDYTLIIHATSDTHNYLLLLL